MTKQVQRRRGTASQHTSFTGAEGEISVNTTNKSVHVHDGVTAGGVEAARADLANVSDASLNTALAGNTLSSLTITSADINGGTIDGTVIGGTTPAAVTATSLTATSSATLQHSASTKLATTSTGVDVTGTVTADGLDADGIVTITDGNVRLDLMESDATDLNGRLQNTGGVLQIRTLNDAKTSAKNRIVIDHSTGDISFYEDTGTTPKFFWDASAEALGIGTTSPSFELDVQGASDTCIRVRATGAGSGDDSLLRMQINNADASNYIQFGDNSDSDAGYIRYQHANDSLQIGVNATERMRIDSSGRVGIGTASPSAPIDVVGSPGTLAEFRDGVAANFIVETSGAVTTIGNQAGSSQLAFKSSNSEAMRITSTGNVGIGTSSPQEPLDVAGDVVLTSTVPTLKFKETDITDQNYQIRLTGGDLLFQTNNDAFSGAQNVARFDSSGNLLVAQSTSVSPGVSNTIAGHSLNSLGYAAHSRSDGAALHLNRNTSDGDIVKFRKDGTTVGSIGVSGVVTYWKSFQATSDTGVGIAGGGQFIAVDNSGSGLDNSRDIGAATIRWDDVYATNGTIQTSDANEKQDIDVLSDAEQRVAVAAKGLLRKFRWKDAVAEKGDDARIHFGIIAQDLQAAFEAEGLDAGKYAMFIHTTWTDEETGEERSRMGVRYSELLAFIIAAL